MSFSEIFIRRPVATTLLTIAIALAGAVAFRLLPVAPLPEVDFPTIQVRGRCRARARRRWLPRWRRRWSANSGALRD